MRLNVMQNQSFVDQYLLTACKALGDIITMPLDVRSAMAKFFKICHAKETVFTVNMHLQILDPRRFAETDCVCSKTD